MATTEIPEGYKHIADAELPSWDSIPDLELYMDQVVSFVTAALEPFVSPTDEKILTPSMVNNYVKKKVMPAPFKKRYRRQHIAYLLMIYIAKNVIALDEIAPLLNEVLNDLQMTEANDETSAAALYSHFLDLHHHAVQAVFFPQADDIVFLEQMEGSRESTRTLFWICMASAARVRSIHHVKQIIDEREQEA